jgi:uncharacterized heparinase superfamily protein
MLRKAIHFTNTVRHLQSRQIMGQLHNRLPRRYKVGLSEEVEFPGVAWPDKVRFLAPGDQKCHAQARNGIFEFINRREMVGFPPKWHRPESPKLWQYNLHYFEWLWGLEYEDARKVVLDWMDGHPLQRSNVGWEPFPISLRVVNWCAVFWGRFRGQIEQDSEFCLRLWQSICCQCAWLTQNLETHLLGNHYFVNGASLAFVGSCFAGDTAKKWLDMGCKILEEQIPEQVLPDGMHFELSPMYHSMVIYMASMLAATCNERLTQLVVEPLGRMRAALDAMCHPDGRTALLNDGAFGIYNEPDELRSFSDTLSGMALPQPSTPKGCFALPDAGYYGWRDVNDNYVVCDFGNIGPDYIPGHAHADMFSFEMSVKGKRIIVDAGVYDYEVSQMRQYCRSTAAHNTVEINGMDQSEMWGAFRVARRAHAQDIRWQAHENGFSLSGWHNGYFRLPGRPKHTRHISWDKLKGLHIRDEMSSTREVQLVSRLHLHPECEVVQVKENQLRVRCEDMHFSITCSDGYTLSTEPSWYCPEFGRKIENKAICLHTAGQEVLLDLRICEEEDNTEAHM